jgi:hypothetical protein
LFRGGDAAGEVAVELLDRVVSWLRQRPAAAVAGESRHLIGAKGRER